MSFWRVAFGSMPIVPVVRLEGVIQSGGRGGIGGSRVINMANTSRMLDRAFAFNRSPAVALVINSPGGSATQSHLVARRIMQLSEEKKRKVYAFVEDAAASGGYILALGAHEIYADPFSMVGSVGVISASFGFTEAMKKVGVERRLTTAGKNKALQDPFSDVSDEDKKRLRDILDSMHVKFKDFVKERRSTKLTKPDDVLFEGDFWLADKALEHGLIDGIGDVRSVIKSKFGKNVLMPVIQPFQMPFPFSTPEFGASNLIDDISSRLRQNQLWEKYGL